MKFDVFISYSRQDLDEVTALANMLCERIPELKTWFDISGVESGDEFDEKIRTAIDNSQFLIFAFSDHALASEWAKKEVTYARNVGTKVIPLLLNGASLKGWFLFDFGRIDCIDSTSEMQVEKLLNNLAKWTGKRLVARPDSPIRPVLSGTPHRTVAAPSPAHAAPQTAPAAGSRRFLLPVSVIVAALIVAGALLLFRPKASGPETVGTMPPAEAAAAGQEASSPAVQASGTAAPAELRSQETAASQTPQQAGITPAPAAPAAGRTAAPEPPQQAPAPSASPSPAGSTPAAPRSAAAPSSTATASPAATGSQAAAPTAPAPAASTASTAPAAELLAKGQAAVRRFKAEQGAEYFRQAIALGSVEANYYLGELYYDGNGVAKSFPTAKTYFQKAAAAGMPDALYMLGVMARNGQGGGKDIDEARRFLMQAAAQGHEKAEKLLNQLP